MIFLEKPKVSSLFLNTARHNFNLQYSNYPYMLLLFILYEIWSQYAPKRINTHTTSQWVMRADTFIAHTHCCTPTCLPPVYLSARWNEGLTKKERRVGRYKWEARLRCGEKVRKMNLTLCSIEKWWVGRKNRWDEKKKKGSQSITVFLLYTITAWPAVTWILCKLSDWLRRQASAWDLPLANYITNSAG